MGATLFNMASEAEETHLTSYKLNRIYRYVRKGHLRKLNNFLNEQYIDIRRVIFSKRRNALHIACKHKQKDIVKFLLRHELNLLLQDAKGNVPLLTSALINLKHKRSGRARKISELLKCACREALTVKNNEGICAQEVLDFIKQKEEESKKKKKSKLKVEISSSDSSESEDSNVFSDFDSEESDSEWFEKMQMEFEDVYFQEFGKFENDFLQFENELRHETYDNWTERMHQEFSAKRRKTNESHYRKRPKTDDKTRNQSTQSNLKREFKPTDELTGLKLRKRKYEKQCKRLFETASEEISLKDLPAPNEMFIRILLSFDSDETAKRCYLKKQQIVWHPDKFLQKCGHRLLVSERDAIFERVNQISQLINSHLDAMTN